MLNNLVFVAGAIELNGASTWWLLC